MKVVELKAAYCSRNHLDCRLAETVGGKRLNVSVLPIVLQSTSSSCFCSVLHLSAHRNVVTLSSRPVGISSLSLSLVRIVSLPSTGVLLVSAYALPFAPPLDISCFMRIWALKTGMVCVTAPSPELRLLLNLPGFLLSFR